VCASFDWVVGIDPEEAVERQREVTRLSAERPLVVQTGVLEEETYNWLPPGTQGAVGTYVHRVALRGWFGDHPGGLGSRWLATPRLSLFTRLTEGWS
jgi:hypothetical protein